MGSRARLNEFISSRLALEFLQWFDDKRFLLYNCLSYSTEVEDTKMEHIGKGIIVIILFMGFGGLFLIVCDWFKRKKEKSSK